MIASSIECLLVRRLRNLNGHDSGQETVHLADQRNGWSRVPILNPTVSSEANHDRSNHPRSRRG